MSSFKTNYIFSLLNTVSGLVFPLITFPYVARVLMPEGIGEVNFFLSIITYISMFTSLGIPTYAIIEIAKVRDNERQKSLVTSEIFLLNLILTVIGYVIVGILCLTVSEVQANIPLFLLMSINIILATIGCEWFYQGTENFKYITVRGIIIRIICVILLFVLVRDKNDLIYYGLYSVLGVAGNNILNFIYLRKNVDVKIIEIKNLNVYRHLMPSLKIFAVNVISSIYLQLDTVMLGFLKDNVAVGYYTGAIRLTKMLMGITTSMGVVLLPRISSMLKYGDNAGIKPLITKTLNFIIALSLPIAMGLFILAPVLIRLFCGDEYLPAITTLKILSPIILFISISYIYAQTILALNRINITIIVGSICSLVNVAANFVLIPIMAQDGAALGTLLAEFASMISYLVISKMIFKSYLVFSEHLFQCVISCAIMVVLIWFVSMYCFDDIIALVMISILGALIYGLSLYCIGNRMFNEHVHIMISKIKNW